MIVTYTEEELYAWGRGSNKTHPITRDILAGKDVRIVGKSLPSEKTEMLKEAIRETVENKIKNTLT